MKPDRNSNYNLVEFCKLLEKIHDDDFTLGEILDIHRRGVPLLFRFEKIITPEDLNLADKGLFLLPPLLLNENKKRDFYRESGWVQYDSTCQMDVQLTDKKWAHKSISFLLNDPAEPPYIDFLKYGEISTYNGIAYIEPGRYSKSEVFEFEKSYREMDENYNYVDSPYQFRVRPIRVDCNNVFINLSNCSEELIPRKFIPSNVNISPLENNNLQEMTKPIKGKPKTTKKRILEEMEKRGFHPSDSLPFGTKAEIVKEIVECSELKAESVGKLFHEMGVSSQHNTIK